MKPIFETKLSVVEHFVGGSQIIIGLAGIIHSASKITSQYWGGQIFLIFFFCIFLVQGIRTTKTFILFKEKLIVRRPLAFSKKTDVIFKTSEIQKVIFRNVRGRFGGPHIIINAKTWDESYRTSLSDESLQIFVEGLSSLGITVVNENKTE